MGNLHIVTGYKGAAHVAAADFGSLNAGMFGTGQKVLNRGNKFSATVVSNNQVRVNDGDIIMQGRHIRLNEGSYVDLAIENGAVGMLRNDLIVARYTKDSRTGVEDCNLIVIKGTPATGSPSDPAYTSGDILNHDILNDMPLYRVPLNGLNVQSLVCLFETAGDFAYNTSFLDAETAIADGDYFPFYDVSASKSKKTLWSNIKSKLEAAFAPKTHASNHAAGGSDAVTPAAIGAAASTHASTHGSSGTDPITPSAIGAASSSALTSHTSSTSNPHGVSRNQLEAARKWILLWTNASPTSSFAAQTVSIDLSAYSMVAIVHYYTTASNYTTTQVIPKGTEGILMIGNQSSSKIGTRNAEVTNTGVIFDAAKYAGTTTNGDIVPVYIYGIE